MPTGHAHAARPVFGVASQPQPRRPQAAIGPFMPQTTLPRPELLGRIPLTARCLLDVGCGEGLLGQAYLRRNPGARYLGLEPSRQARELAAGRIGQVIGGAIEQAETLSSLDALRQGQELDAVIFDNTLECLEEPLRFLAALRGRTRQGGVCVSLVANIAHWTVLEQQLRGRWQPGQAGMPAPEHRRFYTLNEAISLLSRAGWTVLDAMPLVFDAEQTETALARWVPLGVSLGLDLQTVRRDIMACHWLLRSVNGPAMPKLHVVGLGLPKTGGVTEARIDYPQHALDSLPGVKAVCCDTTLTLDPDAPPGVLILQRRVLQETPARELVEQCIGLGWIVVLEIDDDPTHWREYVDTDFYAFRAVHAVTVSTPPLAALVSQWNPHVQVFPNAVFALPEIPIKASADGGPVRIFFGAFNRGPDWDAVLTGILAAAKELGREAAFAVVHDQAFYDALPDDVAKSFQPTLDHAAYMDTLATCEVALLPLSDTAFNRMKSDLKFIECCACGVVPVCSSVVYDAGDAHRAIGLFPDTPESWARQLVMICRDAEERRRRVALGLSYVRAQRMHCHQVPRREAFYRGLLARKDALEKDRQDRLRTAGLRSS